MNSKTKLLFTLALIVLIGLGIGMYLWGQKGSSKGSVPLTPEETTSSAAEPAPSDSSSSPEELPKGKVELSKNDKTQLTTPTVEGYSPSDITEVVDTSVSFVEAGIINPFFLTGEWLEASGKEVGEQFEGVASPYLVEVISGLDKEDPQESRALASIAAILRNPDDFKVHQNCSDGEWEYCLSRPLALSHLTVKEDPNSDSGNDRLIVTLDATTSRRVYHEHEEAHSDLVYAYTLWVGKDNGKWVVEAYQNQYTFGAVVSGEPHGSISVEEHEHYDNE